MSSLVSIIINCHNGERYLKKCLQSVLNQTYENWEVIFWDNCSTDNSEKIFNSFEEKRFFYYESPEFTNLSKARNLAIAKSRGDYVCFLDTDDYWKDNKLLEQIKIFEIKNVSLIFSNFVVENNKSGKNKNSIQNKIENKNIINFFLKKYPVSISTVIFNKKKVLDHYFNERYHCIGDFDFVMKTALNYKIFGIDDSLATVLMHDKNETKRKFKLYTLELSHWYRKYYKSFLKFKNTKTLKSNIYYEMSKILLIEKKYKSFFKLFTKISVIQKTKIFIFYLSSF